MIDIKKELSTKRKQLEQAETNLAQLQNDLPTFQTQYDQALAEETALKQKRASLSELSAQKIQTISASELLEQQVSDIEAESKQVTALKAELQKLDLIANIAKKANDLAEVQKGYKTELYEVLESFFNALDTLNKTKRAKWFDLREMFKEDFYKLSGIYWQYYTMGQEEDREFNRMLELLASYGIDLNILKTLPDHAKGSSLIDNYPSADNLPEVLQEVLSASNLPSYGGDLTLPVLIRAASHIPEYVIYRRNSVAI